MTSQHHRHGGSEENWVNKSLDTKNRGGERHGGRKGRAISNTRIDGLVIFSSLPAKDDESLYGEFNQIPKTAYTPAVLKQTLHG